MTDKELKRLSRGELLELLLEQAKKLESVQAAAADREAELQQQVNDLRSQLDSRAIKVKEAGSLAEASLQLSGVFEAAQEAAETYLESLRVSAGNAEAASAGIIADAQAKADALLAQAKADASETLLAANDLKTRTEKKCAELLSTAQEASEAQTAETNAVCNQLRETAEKEISEKRAAVEAELSEKRAATEKACAEREETTRARMEDYNAQLQKKIQEFYDAHSGLKELLGIMGQNGQK